MPTRRVGIREFRGTSSGFMRQVRLAASFGPGRLPAHDKDPLNHLPIAQAIAEGAPFVSQDSRAPLYPVEVVACC